jgi:hypothetical protein
MSTGLISQIRWTSLNPLSHPSSPYPSRIFPSGSGGMKDVSFFYWTGSHQILNLSLAYAVFFQSTWKVLLFWFCWARNVLLKSSADMSSFIPSTSLAASMHPPPLSTFRRENFAWSLCKCASPRSFIICFCLFPDLIIRSGTQQTNVA